MNRLWRHGTAELANRFDTAIRITRPTAVFFGDSYVAGHTEGGLRFRGWPAKLCREQGWRPSYFAEGGAAYVGRSPRHGLTIGDQIGHAARRSPGAGVVLLAGGRNDYGQPAADVRAAARDTLRALVAAWPDAVHVLVGPVWSGPADALALTMRDAVQAGAGDAGVTLADPIGEGWLMGDDYGFVSPDKVHPTPEGCDYLLGKMRALVFSSASRAAG